MASSSSEGRATGDVWLWSEAAIRDASRHEDQLGKSDHSAVLIPRNPEVMGELVGKFQGSAITSNQPQKEGCGNIKENMVANGDESTLNVTNKGNFFDSYITNIIDSKRRRPDSMGGHVPPKTKDLVWRAASNCLATKVNLCINKVLTDNNCPMCCVFAESEMHLLVSCQFAWACWEYSGFSAADRNSNSLLSWLNFNATRLDNEKLGRVAVLCWAIWSARNDMLWKGRVRSVKDVVDFAQSSLVQFLQAQGKNNLPAMSPLKPSDGSVVWTKPTEGIKLNVDAAIFDHDFKHGFGN
ncbi:hypothetical protein F8388_002002 [Cannabis sativa]|uniref:Reverse transcriptase zinc-binding domain-containing protein n=1 Tax=Cannabis sativa TaxID=3483 RepID=A0A7J6FL93_CANSA|nr:hypothetical protein F8388_002002 [Cannabis sativa]KAF4398645.1 hypothetical protein G4B88_013734 [Cannabis sativa]